MKEDLRFLLINGTMMKDRALKTAFKTYLTFISLYLRIIFLHFMSQIDPSGRAYNMGLPRAHCLAGHCIQHVPPSHLLPFT